MHTRIPSDTKNQMVEAWVKGWTITRGLAPPLMDHGGYRIDLGWPKQIRRHIFTELNAGFKALVSEISDPWIFLKVCAAPELVKACLPAPWIMESPRFMMICFKPMHQSQIPLPAGYTLRVEKDQAVSVVRIIHDHVIVAIGRVVLVDGYIIYDRIETTAEHRRKGLATIIMLELEEIALAQGGTKGVLVATTEGKNLYEKLGWEMYTEYTTAVIPGPEGHV